MIPVKGLKTGKHQYSFDIDKEFFESYNKSEIKGADLKADIEMTVEVKTISLTVCFNGFIEVVCDRCLEYVQLPLHFSDKTYVEKGKSEESDNSEMIVIPENEHEIDLTQYLYECIMLSLPYQVVHQDDKEGNSTCISSCRRCAGPCDRSPDRSSVQVLFGVCAGANRTKR